MVMLLPLLWAPGLLGLLALLGFDGTIARAVLGAGVIVMLWSAVLNSRGTFKARQHVADMLPWALTVWTLALVLR